VKEAGELGSITTKSTGKTIPKRDLLLVDQSGVQTRLTLWGKAAEDWAHSGAPTLACRGVKVGDFGGRSLSTLSSSSVLVNPDIPHSHHLRGWFDAEGKDASFAAQAGAGGGGVGGGGGAFRRDEFRTLHDVKEANLGWNEKGDFFSVRATIAHIKPDPVSYPGCPTCNKKVNEIGDKWRCEKCDTSYDAPRYRCAPDRPAAARARLTPCRYMISFAATDYTDQAWLSGFNDAGEVITGITADDLNRLKVCSLTSPRSMPLTPARRRRATRRSGP
jgi:replication factor A1